MDLEIKELKNLDLIPYELLLLADPSKVNVNQYIFNSSVYTAHQAGQMVGCYVLYKRDHKTIEIKNVSVLSDYQGKGIGTRLLHDAIDKAKLNGFKKIVIGTGNSSVGQLYLYQKVGFRITEILPDFFKKNYADPIIENGIECRDMIVLTKEL
jgi:ribosomal protein S18 acetylase RimI-like enzyme